MIPIELKPQERGMNKIKFIDWLFYSVFQVYSKPTYAHPRVDHLVSFFVFFIGLMCSFLKSQQAI